jgi:hypothetical protein
LVPVILIPPEGFPVVFLAFLGGLRSIGTFRLQARVLEALALNPTEGSRADIGMAGIGMLLSNPGMGKIKLSKSCIQEIKI